MNGKEDEEEVYGIKDMGERQARSLGNGGGESNLTNWAKGVGFVLSPCPLLRLFPQAAVLHFQRVCPKPLGRPVVVWLALSEFLRGDGD